MTPDLKTITVLNPQRETVEIRPQELLQVVFTARERVSWNIPDHLDTTRAALEKTISLKPIRWETFFSDGFDRDGRGNFPIFPMAAFKAPEIQQNHYWFRVNPADHMKVQKMEEPERQIATIFFYEGRAVVGKLKVILKVDERDKGEFFDLMEATVWTGRDPVGNEAHTTGCTVRRIDEDAGYILNPGDNEQIIFETRQREMLVEMVEPRALPNGKWKLFASGNADHYGIAELQNRQINGKRVQRILVKNLLHDLPPGFERMRLGTLKLRALDSDNKHNPQFDKMLHFWVTRQREVTSDFDEDVDLDIDEEEIMVQQIRRMMAAEPITVCRPRRSKVTIEEFSRDLTEGVNLIKVFTPRVKEREIIDPADNMNITLTKGTKLVVHLYRDTSYRTQHSEWSVAYPGHCVVLDYVEIDHHRQKFYFTRYDHPQRATETLIFRVGDRKRTMHVHMDEKFSECSIYTCDYED